MIEILSQPRRIKTATNQALLKLFSFKTGLPINSLPGWEQIPLNCKLPMLKCPGNQVIFTKNKVGKSYVVEKHEFDTSTTGHIPEYNPLHDRNLKTFFSNERNLKRLRQNGEITQDNDVKCNLKDFNAYREELHKGHLYYVMQVYKRREAEQHDRILIANAEAITKRDHQNLGARHHCHEEILARRDRLFMEKHERFLHLASITAERVKRLDNLAAMQSMLVAHRKMMNKMRLETHLSITKDLQRKNLIKLKKLFQFKKDRFNKNMSNLRKKRTAQSNERKIESWGKRLNERISKQRHLHLLMNELEKERTFFIEQHKKKYREKWEEIQEDIKERSHQAWLARQPKKHKKKKKQRRPKLTSREELRNNFEGLQDSQLGNALDAAISMGMNANAISPDDPIYKPAQFILNYILSHYDKDLSEDACALKIMLSRIENFVCDAKKYVTYKAQRIIDFLSDRITLVEGTALWQCLLPSYDQKHGSDVGFTQIAKIIGAASYEIYPFVDVRLGAQRRRRATPVGSLTSLTTKVDEQVKHGQMRMPHLERKDIVFIEHYLVKFKRALLNGLDKNVFKAIECRFENRITEIREELLKLDRDFLYKQIAISILSFAVNPLNFESVLKLAISVLSTEIIWELQETTLRPGIKPRSMEQPVICGPMEQDNYMLCNHRH